MCRGLTVSCRGWQMWRATLSETVACSCEVRAKEGAESFFSNPNCLHNFSWFVSAPRVPSWRWFILSPSLHLSLSLSLFPFRPVSHSYTTLLFLQRRTMSLLIFFFLLFLLTSRKFFTYFSFRFLLRKINTRFSWCGPRWRKKKYKGKQRENSFIWVEYFLWNGFFLLFRH